MTSTTFMEQVNRTPFTFLVLLAYITLAMVTGIIEVDGEKLDQFGAARAFLIANGEPWRLLTYAFLHGGLLHLFLNSYFLFLLGPSLEQTLGTPRFIALYVVAAIGGGVGGSLWHHPIAPLVGGSGALFGMLGCALALNMRQGRHVLDFLNYAGPRQLIMLIVINLIIGFLIPMISNAGHIGGLIAGFALTFCFFERGRDQPDRTSRVIQIGWVALFLCLTLYSIRPVARWDYLYGRLGEVEAQGPSEERSAIARALLDADPDRNFLRYFHEPEKHEDILATIKAYADGY